MDLLNQFDKLINTYQTLLQKCHDALAPTATQRSRNELRDAIGAYLQKHKAEPQRGDSSGGSQ